MLIGQLSSVWPKKVSRSLIDIFFAIIGWSLSLVQLVLLMLYSFKAQRQKKSNLLLLRCQTQVLSHLFSWKREYHQFAQVSQLFYCITGILGLFPCYALLFTSSPPCERLILEGVFLRAWFVGNWLSSLSFSLPRTKTILPACDVG